MNTKQLIAFWYTGLFLVIVLIGFASEYSDISLWLYLGAILTLGFMFVYSFGSHPNSNKKIVAYSVLVPLAILLTIPLIIFYNNEFGNNQNLTSVITKTDFISIDEIEIFDAKLSSNNDFGWSTITGRVRNNSDIPLRTIVIRVNIYEEGKLVDGSDINIIFNQEVPPNAVQSFTENVFKINFPNKWTWSFTIKDVAS